MFTGIIEAVAPISRITPLSGKKLLTITRPESFTDITPGASIACNGICLTVLEYTKTSFNVELMNETISKSTAKAWQPGRMLNLERALQMGGRLDGHWVQGHVDREIRMIAYQLLKGTVYLRFELVNEDRGLLVHQGSVAVNGVSLTIAELKPDWFSVALIGHTLAGTNLKELRGGEKVNVEYDVLGKYILRQKDNTYGKTHNFT